MQQLPSRFRLQHRMLGLSSSIAYHTRRRITVHIRLWNREDVQEFRGGDEDVLWEVWRDVYVCL